MNLNANNDIALTELRGHNDWANLVYDFKNSPTFAPGAPPERLDCNFTPAMVAFMDSLPSPCRADFDDSGTRTINDIFIFLSAWFALDPRCDIDGLNGVNVADIFAFLSAWFAGC